MFGKRISLWLKSINAKWRDAERRVRPVGDLDSTRAVLNATLLGDKEGLVSVAVLGA